MPFCSTTRPSAPGGFARLADRLGNIWVGVVLLALIFIYSSIGSAAPPIRQGALADWLGIEALRFEKTEMQWFSWWPFKLLIGLLCGSMVLATVRIRLNLVKAGVWAIHSGIILLALASAVYFGRKVEGDVAVFHSQALVLAPGLREPAVFVVRPEAEAAIGPEGQKYGIRVARLDPDYVIPAGPAAGRTATAVWLAVDAPDAPARFARLLVVGYPELTEDYLIENAGVARVADRLGGRRLLDEGLQVQLWYDPQRYFYLNDTSAVYARLAGERDWSELRADGMPQYFEHVDEPASLWAAPGEPPVVPRPLDVPLRPGQPAELEGIGLRITGYLPYARDEQAWLPGGESLNPLLRVRIRAPVADTSEVLLAADPQRSRVRLPMAPAIEFAWAQDGAARERLAARPVPRLAVKIGRQKLERTLRLADLKAGGTVAVEGTDYSIALTRTLPAGAGQAATPPALLVRVSRPGGAFNRLVFQGRDDGGIDLDDQMGMRAAPADPDLDLEYLDAPDDRLLVVASDDSGRFEAVRTTVEGGYERSTFKLGDPISLTANLQLTAEQIVRNAREVSRPMIVPRRQRQPASLVGRSYAQARVEIRLGDWSQKVWLRYHDYALPDVQRAQPGRFLFDPARVRLPDGREVELLFSRWRQPLPSAVALDRFVLKTYPGGDQPSDYISRVRFDENGGWGPIAEVRSNHPIRHGDLWYFQSQYDPQTRSHTVLGVGNRVGVGGMLAGVCLSIAGMLYTFYVKPVIVRRRQLQAAAAGVHPAPPEMITAAGGPGREVDDFPESRPAPSGTPAEVN